MKNVIKEAEIDLFLFQFYTKQKNSSQLYSNKIQEIQKQKPIDIEGRLSHQIINLLLFSFFASLCLRLNVYLSIKIL